MWLCLRFDGLCLYVCVCVCSSVCVVMGLDWLIGGFEMVDPLIGGWIVWVDHR